MGRWVGGWRKKEKWEDGRKEGGRERKRERERDRGRGDRGIGREIEIERGRGRGTGREEEREREREGERKMEGAVRDRKRLGNLGGNEHTPDGSSIL